MQPAEIGEHFPGAAWDAGVDQRQSVGIPQQVLVASNPRYEMDIGKDFHVIPPMPERTWSQDWIPLQLVICSCVSSVSRLSVNLVVVKRGHYTQVGSSKT